MTRIAAATGRELYEFTRGHWMLNPERANQATYALSVFDGVIQEVSEIAQWFKSGATFNDRASARYLDDADRSYDNRYEFVGRLANKNIHSQYKHKSVETLFKKGNSNPIMYMNS